MTAVRLPYTIDRVPPPQFQLSALHLPLTSLPTTTKHAASYAPSHNAEHAGTTYLGPGHVTPRLRTQTMVSEPQPGLRDTTTLPLTWAYPTAALSQRHRRSLTLSATTHQEPANLCSGNYTADTAYNVDVHQKPAPPTWCDSLKKGRCML